MSSTHTVTIDCPACGVGRITMLPMQLLTGTSFSCGSCATAVSLMPESRTPLQRGLEDFKRLEAMTKA